MLNTFVCVGYSFTVLHVCFMILVLLFQLCYLKIIDLLHLFEVQGRHSVISRVFRLIKIRRIVEVKIFVETNLLFEFNCFSLEH